jgi:hypothetical protein
MKIEWKAHLLTLEANGFMIMNHFFRGLPLE